MVTWSTSIATRRCGKLVAMPVSVTSFRFVVGCAMVLRMAEKAWEAEWSKTSTNLGSKICLAYLVLVQGNQTQIHNAFLWNFTSTSQAFLWMPSMESCESNIIVTDKGSSAASAELRGLS
ncbi:hypothetical protein ACFX1W_006750 [Malus domestica]